MYAYKYRSSPPNKVDTISFWRERPNLAAAGATKLGGSRGAQTWTDRVDFIAVSGGSAQTLQQWRYLYERTPLRSNAAVWKDWPYSGRKHQFFCPVIDLSGGYSDLANVMLHNTLMLWVECHQSWRFVGRLFQFYDTFPRIPKWPWAWMLELHWLLQYLCIRQEDGGEGNRGS